MSEETTSIEELPITQKAPSNKVVVQNLRNQGENIQETQIGSNTPNELNNIIAGLQKAASTGGTELPSRDRPMQTNEVLMDQNIKPDYIPEQPAVDYIKNYNTQQEQLQQLKCDKQRTLNLSYLIDELQIPIIVCLLFYIFQMPYTNSLFQKYLTFMFKNDGHYNQLGYISISLLFSIIYYAITI